MKLVNRTVLLSALIASYSAQPKCVLAADDPLAITAPGAAAGAGGGRAATANDTADQGFPTAASDEWEGGRPGGLWRELLNSFKFDFESSLDDDLKSTLFNHIDYEDRTIITSAFKGVDPDQIQPRAEAIASVLRAEPMRRGLLSGMDSYDRAQTIGIFARVDAAEIAPRFGAIKAHKAVLFPPSIDPYVQIEIIDVLAKLDVDKTNAIAAYLGRVVINDDKYGHDDYGYAREAAIKALAELDVSTIAANPKMEFKRDISGHLRAEITDTPMAGGADGSLTGAGDGASAQ